jgi:hypothetical protein
MKRSNFTCFRLLNVGKVWGIFSCT